MEPLVSVLIVTWNSRDDVARCLDALRRTAGDVAVEVVVVDNGSSDGTVDAVRERWPDAVVHRNEANAGFPRANNQALALSRGRYVLYLNPDTEPGPDALEASVAALESDPGVGVVGCRLVYPDGSTQYECARRDYRLGDLLFESAWLHMLFPRHPLFARQLMGDWDHMDDRDVDAVSGAFMLARREAAEAVGGLPDDVFMYHEDLSFCLRVRRAGWRVRYLAGVTTIHHSGRSAARSPARLYLLEGEAKVRLVREAQGRVAGALARALFAGRSLARLLLAVAARPVPGLGWVRARYPRVFHIEKHWLQLVWSVWPRAVRSRIPRPEPASDAAGPEPGRVAAKGHER